MTLPARSLAVLSLFLSLSPFRARAAGADPFTEATQAFQRAAAGAAGEAARADALLRALAAERPDDPVVLAYAGAAAALVGRDVSSPVDRVKAVDAGLDEIDLALRKLGPEHDRPLPGRLPPRMETLLVAASTFLGVPDEVFRRREDGKAALAQALAHPTYPHLPAQVRARFQWLGATVARAEARPAEERGALQEVVALDPAGPLAAQARARLAEVAP